MIATRHMWTLQTRCICLCLSAQHSIESSFLFIQYLTQILSSRVQSGLTLVEAIKRAHDAHLKDKTHTPVKYFITSSAVGIYAVNNKQRYLWLKMHDLLLWCFSFIIFWTILHELFYGVDDWGRKYILHHFASLHHNSNKDILTF